MKTKIKITLERLQREQWVQQTAGLRQPTTTNSQPLPDAYKVKKITGAITVGRNWRAGDEITEKDAEFLSSLTNCEVTVIASD